MEYGTDAGHEHACRDSGVWADGTTSCFWSQIGVLAGSQLVHSEKMRSVIACDAWGSGHHDCNRYAVNDRNHTLIRYAVIDRNKICGR